MKARALAVLLSLSVITIPSHADTASEKSSVSTGVAHKIDLNKADAKALTGSFKGIGKKRAEAIVAYRTEHNGIKAIDELAQVKGFGQRFVTVNKAKLAEVFEVSK